MFSCQLISCTQTNFASDTIPDWLPPAKEGTKRLSKDCLHLGKLKHPEAGWEMELNYADLLRMAETANRMIKNGVNIPAPLDHKDGADFNTGYWSGFWVKGGEKDAVLMGSLDIDNETYKDKIGTSIKEVSVRIMKEYEDGKGNKYNDALVHVSPCLYPIVTGQGNFESIAASGAKNGWQTFLSVNPTQEQEKHMDKLKDLAKALGIEVPDDADEDKILSLITEHNQKRDEEVKNLSTKLEELTKEEGKKEEEEIPESVKKQISSLQASVRSAYAKDVEHRSEKLINDGKALPADIKKLGLEKIDASKLQLDDEGKDPMIEAKLQTLESLEKRHELSKDLARSFNSGTGDDDTKAAAINNIVKKDLELAGYPMKETN